MRRVEDEEEEEEGEEEKDLGRYLFIDSVKGWVWQLIMTQDSDTDINFLP